MKKDKIVDYIDDPELYRLGAIAKKAGNEAVLKALKYSYTLILFNVFLLYMLSKP